MSIKTFIGIKDTSIKSVSNAPVGSIKTILGSGLNPSPSEDIADAMLFEDGNEFYMIEEDSTNYLQLVDGVIPSEDISDSMLFEEWSEFYMTEENSENYLQLVELT